MTHTLALSELSALFPILDSLIAKNIRIFLLQGDLASGKTTLVQRYFQYKLDSTSAITSPTFSLVQSYGDLHHYDLYQYGVVDFLKLGLLENFDSEIHFIEWGEKLEGILINSGYNYCVINITKVNHKRTYRISHV